MKLRFDVDGEPTAKGRPRFVNRGEFTVAYTPKDTVSYENLVKTTYRQVCGQARFADDAQIVAVIKAYFTIPRSASKKARAAMLNGSVQPTKTSDADNIGKIILDALNGIAYRDDKQVVDLWVRKFWGEQPRVEVFLREKEIDNETK